MSRARRFSSAALVAALVAACLLAGASGADALPRSVPLSVEFANLLPGGSASHSWQVDIPYDARLQKAAVHRQGPGVADWTATLCPSRGGACLDLLGAVDGKPVAAGSYVLAVGVTVTSFAPGDAQQMDGRLTFVQRDPGSLAMTGAGSVVPLLSAALAAVLVGLLLFVIARRRHSDEQVTPGAPR
ncbi:hypothetical protein [Cellulomonas alba]|uniref:Gram-positive cocci surface proteins LPxTG domain-containing protein n=1 Tax=Cellulomonas alba TaxID=3053467 RepID=A0ABT7SH03_9CELL|nr:hypothetical protein [Cellulomonas alba]MDM7855421.1 hypothetical protein [Cellulomonas alba]